MWLWLVVLISTCFGAPRTFKSCDEDDTSKTPGYKIASEMLTKSINFSADPCTDFFEFTCGQWISSNPIPSHKTSYSQFGKLSDRVQEQMRDAFESPEIFPSKSMNALKYMYHKCMDKEQLNKIGSTRLLQTIRSYGVWPMVDGNDKFRVENFDLTSLLIHVSEVRGLDVFVANYVSLDNKNVSRRVVEVRTAVAESS
ncbi:hypothetical protein GCK32_018626 [Trichostrongylus colubriformis]|uniref:Peptidase M13 N-terminal domain-containing protein n=1 Tax=Trichostrongylus colubriformis TaxID=6319 RepID=A0AAN8IIH8_TRICO